MHLDRYAFVKIFFTIIMPNPAAAMEPILFAATYDSALVVLPSEIQLTTSKENVLKVVKLRTKCGNRQQNRIHVHYPQIDDLDHT